MHKICFYVLLTEYFICASLGRPDVNNDDVLPLPRRPYPGSNQLQNQFGGGTNFDGDSSYEQISMYRGGQMLQPHGGHQMENLNFNGTKRNRGVKIQVQLKNYENPDLRLPGGTTCQCPSGFSCSYMGSIPAKCSISFTIIVSSPDDSVQYVATEFLPLTATGIIDVANMNMQQRASWEDSHTFYTSSKPPAIDIFVHNLGTVINARTGELVQIQTVAHIDTFVLSLDGITPSIHGYLHTEQSATIIGSLLNTQLTISYFAECLGSFIGPNCDLSCNRSSVHAGHAICKSNSTGYFSTCTKLNNQVEQCTPCPYGVSNSGYCQDENGGVIQPSNAPLVAQAFKTATISLAIIAGLLFLLLMILTLISIQYAKKTKCEAVAPGHNYHSSLREEGNANRPLLQANYTSQTPSVNDASFARPVVRPTATPNLDAIPAKSSMRKANMIPPAHLGGNSSINESLNSSYASNVPIPPSREADV